MPSLADVVRRHGPDYVTRFGRAVLPSHARALRDIARCRTEEMGGHIVHCEDCGAEHARHHSCRNRACGQCGADRTDAWLRHQRDLLLPVRYFHVVFTVPAELRFIIRSYQGPLLGALFRAAFESLSALCWDPKHLGGRIGALAVLHTWSRTLDWHPHIHMLVPGGALDDNGRWLRVRHRKKEFLVPVDALAEKFRGRFLYLARQAVPTVRLPYLPKEKKWNVFCKPSVQGPARVLEYLGRYVHKTALSNRAIVECTDRSVTFRYRDSKDQRHRTMTLRPGEFLRRFLQHVLPRGFHRVRAYGLLHSSQRTTLRRLQLMLQRRGTVDSTLEQQRPRRRPCCPTCKSERLRIVRQIAAAGGRRHSAAELCDLPQLARGPPP
jgi:hypothetical protein